MLDVINRYLHGFVSVPIILACKKKGLFELLEHHGKLTLEQIVELLGANSGHLQVALRMMRSLNWLERNEIGQYSLTDEAQLHQKIPEEILDLYHLPLYLYIKGEQQLDLLKDWIERSSQRWNVEDPMMADFLDGILVIPILLALHKHNLLVEDKHKPLFSQLSDSVRQELCKLFTSKGWAHQKEGHFYLTDVGQFIVERALITGTTASYTPMLSRMSDVLFGDCQTVFAPDASGQETHIDRILNVVASGFQHEKYFADVEDIILSIFNRLPIEEQPKYVVDMGCGDGTLLKRVYETIQSKSARGKVLYQYPLHLIGVDYNEVSITATARTLADLPHLVLKGDIGDPEQMITSLKSHGIHDPENILHIRSFLDHDRPFIPPQNLDKLQARSRLPYQGVYVAPNGDLIPLHVMVQSLVEHLERWSKVFTNQGLIILEVHCLEPDVVNKFLDKSENLHFDALQAFSMQHLVEADVFLMAAAEVGLFPKFEFSKRYPKIFPFTRITLSCFKKRPYTIRHPHLSDLSALVNLEAKCWPEHLRASSDEIRQRIECFPNGHCVLEMDSQIVGVIYSQRISSADALKNITYAEVPSLHTRLGSIIQLLSINILPEMQAMGLGDSLREFMLKFCALKGGIESVVGVTRCKNYVTHAHIPIEEYIHHHNELGQLVDPILHFHQQGGARIKGIIPNYRKEDVENFGNGVLIEYDIYNRLSHSSTVVKKELGQKRFRVELKENETLDDLIEKCVRFVLGDRRRAAFAPKRPLMEMGLDSLELLELRTLLSQRLEVELEPTFFFQYGTKDAIARYFKGTSGKDVRTALPKLDKPENSCENNSDSSEVIDNSEDLIAIIGMSCRFPGGINNPAQYWSVLRNGINAIVEVPKDRWDIEHYYAPEPGRPGKISSKYGGFLEQVNQFDAPFFRISPREAASIDPQQRILLEETWIALENAGINPESLAGTQTGVFVGIFSHDYELLQVKYNSEEDFNAYFGTGNSASIAAGRLSYFFGFTGPALAVDTACSSSLVAVHLASHSLLRGECDLAVASGVNLLLSPELSITFSQAGMLSPDGQCKTFDAGANGYVRSEGCGVVVLKRLKKALAEGDNILAAIRGTAINQDGTSSCLTAPNQLSQEAVIQKALSMAKVSPSQVSYVEAHGTGTSLGDPIEVKAIEALYGQERDCDNPLVIGSVKTNIGHTEAASGIAGLIKVVLSMQNKYIPPHLHFKELNPHMTLDGIPAVIPTVGMEWKLPQSGRRIAGVSSFGFSGTNAHVVLEEASVEAQVRKNFNRSHHLLTLSAKSEIALRELGQSYEDFLATNPESSLADVCFTANTGRSHFEHRLALVAESTVQLREQLSAFTSQRETPGLVSGCITSITPKVAFLFTGQGSQYVGMAQQLYQTQPTFRQALDRCDEILRPYLETSLLSVLYPSAMGESTLLDSTAYTQPALFALEYALFELWKSWGITPDAVMGHSVGEYVAATVAGVFSLEDGLKLIAQRGRLMQALPSDGEMVAVLAGEERVTAAIAPYTQEVSIAAINGPKSIVISGRQRAIRSIVADLEASGVKTTPLQVSHAFHSPLMEPMLSDFQRFVDDVTFSLPQINLVSNVTGQLAGEEITTPEYWCRHIRSTVRFAASMSTLHSKGYQVFVEIGAKPTLLRMGRYCLPEGVGVLLPSLRQGCSDWQQILESLAELHVQGIAVDWSGFWRDYSPHRLMLPNYPWQREPYWYKFSDSQAKKPEQLSQPTAEKTDNYLYEYQWRLKARPEQEFVHSSAAYLPTALQIALSVQPQTERLSQQHRRKQYYSVVEPQLDALCTAYIVQALTQLGWQPKLHTSVGVNSLVEKLGVAEQHKRLLGRMLEILQEDGILTSLNNQWLLCQLPELPDTQKIWQELVAQHPSYIAELKLLGQCGSHLASVLRGELDPLGLIFPETSLTTSEHLYQDSPTFRIYNQLTQKAIAAFVASLPKEQTIRILEIGAGTGSLTSYVLPVLPGNRCEYIFTDISQVFTAAAKKKFSDYPFISYQILDIEKDPIAQGFSAHSFDLVIASDAIHATRDLRQTLANVKQLLAFKGLLVLLELTKAPRWSDLVFGLLKGWWLFSDLDLRQSHPLLSAKKWHDLLIEEGFEEVSGISDTEATQESLHTVLLATAPVIENVEAFHQTSLSAGLKGSHQSQQPGNWLIFTDSVGVGQQLAISLKERSQTPILISPGTAFLKLNEYHFQIRTQHQEDLQQVIETVSARGGTCRGIVHLWSLNTPQVEQTTVATLESAQTLGCLSVLNLVQALVKANGKDSPRLFLVTNSTQLMGGSVKPLSIAQSPLWGFGRVLTNEHPESRCTLVDLSQTISKEEIQSLFDELWSDSEEDEIALRGEARYVHRLMPVGLETSHAMSLKSSQNQNSFRLEISTPGILDNLTLRTTTRPNPAPNELEIQVCATGLNFQDVAKAMNLLADVDLEENFSQRSVGLECAGIITAIGSGVEGWKIGDEVIALALNSFGTYTKTDARLVVHKPPRFSFEEAATIPVVFLTAYYALHYLGRIGKGERVLIHAATGGVGLAAIQIAQNAGAEIFATAGSPEKRELLKSLGVKYVMDSRSLAFAEQVMELTGGKGVDIVLNSLTGEAIPKSLSVLGAYGRFLEIGKRDIDKNSNLGISLFPKNLSFFTVDVDRLLQERPDLSSSLFRELMQYFNLGTFHPLPHRVFPISQAVNAFRYMAQAKHIGKIVVDLLAPVVIPDAVEEMIAFRESGTYLITGGLGGFGLAVAKWLVENGARHLVLMGRSGALSPTANSAIEAMKQGGAEVIVAKADVTDSQQLQRVLAEIPPHAPLRGIIHGAMVLDDGLVVQLNSERMHKAMAPKMVGAWNLHTQTLKTPLDFFVIFSSLTSVVGNPGQANYVAGGAFVDALAHHRRAINLPALTINWGSVGDVGYVVQNADVGEHFQRIGVKPMPLQKVLKKLGALILQQQAIQIAVVDMDWRQWCGVHAAGGSPRFSYLLDEVAVSVQADVHSSEEDSSHNALVPATPAQQNQLLETRITEQVASIMGISATKLDIMRSLLQLGLDSLMAVELSHRLKSKIGVNLSTMKIMQGLSISQLAERSLEQLALESIKLSVSAAVENSEEEEEISL